MARIARICRPFRRCGDWRTCEICARVRQAHLAERGEALQNQFDTLFLSVLKPVEPSAHAIQRIRAAVIRRAFAPAGIWSVEQGQKLGRLHLNILAPAPVPDILRDCETWSQVITTSGRAAAAYINKKSGFPDRANYSGNITGSWSSLPDLFASRNMPATVMAASAEAALSNRHPEEYLRAAMASRERAAAESPKTRAEYHEIARRNLPNLYAILRNRQPGED